MYDLEQKSISLRFKELRKILNLNQIEFSNSIGINRHIVTKIETGDQGISYDTLKNVINYHNVNPLWLYTGLGDIFINDSLNIKSDTSELNVDLYNVEAFGGFSVANFQPEKIQERWHIPNLIGKHIALPVQGNSMSPTINKGDKIVAKEVFRNELQDGNVYIFVSRDSGVRVKRLRLYDNATILWSDNALYEPRSEKLDIENIVKIYHVVMVCRAI